MGCGRRQVGGSAGRPDEDEELNSSDRTGNRDDGSCRKKRKIARLIPDGPLPVIKRGLLLPPPPPTNPSPDAELRSKPTSNLLNRQEQVRRLSTRPLRRATP